MEISSFHIRSSGRDLTQVRRTDRTTQARKSGVVDPSTLGKAALVAHAESQGVDASGTKAAILERLTPESNDATVTTDG